MFRGVKKVMSFLLALAVLLAPLEFAVAHDMSAMAADSEMLMLHADQQMDHAMADSDEQKCDGQSSCNDCVYCSPALSITTEIALDKPISVQAQTIFVSLYSIDLPVEYRPPRQL